MKLFERILREDSVDDIISTVKNPNFEKAVDFLEEYGIDTEVVVTAPGGKICYIRNDFPYAEFIANGKVHKLKGIEIYSDDKERMILQDRPYGGGWYCRLEDIYISGQNINGDEIPEGLNESTKRMKENTSIDGENNAYTILDYIKSEILGYDFYFEGGNGMTKMRQSISTKIDELENIFLDMSECSFDYLGSEPLSKLEDLSSELYTLGSMQDNKADGNFVKEIAQALKNKTFEAKQNLRNVDYSNGRDKTIDENEPLFDIYLRYIDQGGGEEDGDPSYEDLTFDELEKTAKAIIKKFLSNRLYGSYKYSPVDHEEDGEITGISKAEYEKCDDKESCEVNRLVIGMYPTRGTEDSFKIIVNGDGGIVKDTFGLNESSKNSASRLREHKINVSFINDEDISEIIEVFHNRDEFGFAQYVEDLAQAYISYRGDCENHIIFNDALSFLLDDEPTSDEEVVLWIDKNIERLYHEYNR